jgi:hypothetical protein
MDTVRLTIWRIPPNTGLDTEHRGQATLTGRNVARVLWMTPHPAVPVVHVQRLPTH